MKPLWIVARNTFKEVIRDRILYGLFVFAILIIGMSLALGQLSFAEQTRITLDFGLMAIHLSAVGIAIFVGATLVVKELDKQTVLTVLVRPLSRSQFILGKFLGLILVIVTVMFGLALILSGIFLFMGQPLTPQFFVALTGILLESICLLGFSLLFSVFARPISVVIFSLGVFLIGHWLSSLRYFGEKLPGSSVDWIYRILKFVLPDFELLNWKSLVVYNDPLQLPMRLQAGIYALLWIGFLVALTAAVFERKDLV